MAYQSILEETREGIAQEDAARAGALQEAWEWDDARARAEQQEALSKTTETEATAQEEPCTVAAAAHQCKLPLPRGPFQGVILLAFPRFLLQALAWCHQLLICLYHVK